VQSSGLPIRVRLFIDSLGTVAAIAVLQASDIDADAVRRIKGMFYGTAFIAGRRGGLDVASYLDIELQLEPTPSRTFVARQP
jgi:hypothetical protein